MSDNSIRCPLCRAAMVVRKRSDRSKFYGCVMFPSCKGTREIGFSSDEPPKPDRKSAASGERFDD